MIVHMDINLNLETSYSPSFMRLVPCSRFYPTLYFYPRFAIDRGGLYMMPRGLGDRALASPKGMKWHWDSLNFCFVRLKMLQRNNRFVECN
jgi:hypothetical protein